MPYLKKSAIQAAVKVFYAVRMVIVACLCLLIGFTTRQLLDAYVPEMIPFLKKNRFDAEIHVVPTPQQDVTVSLEPVEPHWN